MKLLTSMTIKRDELEDYLSKGTFWNIVKDHAIDFHLTNDRLTQLCTNDLKKYDITTSSFFTHSGIQIALDDVNYIEVY